MRCGLAARVQLQPLALKVEGDGVLANVGREDLLELVPGDLARARGIEEAEGDFVFGIRAGQQVLKDGAAGTRRNRYGGVSLVPEWHILPRRLL